MSGLVDKATGTIQSSYPYKDRGDSIQNSFDAELRGNLHLFGREHELVFGALHSVQNHDTDSFGASDFPSDVPFLNWNGKSFPTPTFSTTPTRDVDERIEQNGYYAALRLNPTDRLKIIGGGRLASWKQTGQNYQAPVEYGEDNVFIPYVGVLYDLTPNHRLYASYTKIFQPQNALDRNLRQLQPLDGKSYEIGLKSAFFNEALQTSIALFRIEQDNVAQPDIMVIAPGGGLPQQTYIAANGTVSKGFELEVTGKPLRGWNVNFGYSQFKAEDGDGNPFNTDQPRRLLKLFTTYDLPGALDGLTIGGGVNYRSKAYSTGPNPVTNAAFRFQQDAYTLVNLMVRYALTERLQLQANFENVLDKPYYSQIGFYSQYRYGEPRNFTLGANYRF
jgi:outer membrane receptor for ferric coprogen and ferric-rhodotorulic acid